MRNHLKHNSNPFELGQDVEISKEVIKVVSELSKTALRIYEYLYLYGTKIDGVVYVELKELKFELNFKQNKSVYNGVSELINQDILATSDEKMKYYYNPKYIAQ